MSILTATAPATGTDRRRAHRNHYRFAVRLRVWQPFSPPFTVFGTTLDLNMEGCRIRVDRKIVREARCRVEFLWASGRVEPTSLEATVRNVARCRQDADGRYEVGLQFEAPVKLIRAPGAF